MIEKDELKIAFRVILIVLGVVFALFQTAFPTATTSLVFKYILLILGAVYLIYKIVIIENPSAQIIFVISIVLGLIALIGFNHLFDVGSCNLETPCLEGQFCATDHLCHQLPIYTYNINKTIIHQHIDFSLGGFIIALGILISGFILRKTSFYSELSSFFKVNKKQKKS